MVLVTKQKTSSYDFEIRKPILHETVKKVLIGIIEKVVEADKWE